jgi:hypothetical protein
LLLLVRTGWDEEGGEVEAVLGGVLRGIHFKELRAGLDEHVKDTDDQHAYILIPMPCPMS